MKLFLHQPLGYSNQGGRSNNEDAIFPAADAATPFQPWFMVCDGVGGAARGEIASHIAVESFNDYFIQHQEPVATQPYIQSALDYVQSQFDNYLNRHPEGHGMATTLTLLYFHEAGATVAHVGDSRVYHLRKGKVIWRTEDHSLVNQLLRAGVITREEAREHPQRNVIERAIQGSSKAVKADVQMLNDVRPGDYFFLCTDGVLERVSDELLENVLGSDDSNEQKKQTLIDCCAGKTRDNFSAYLVQIESVDGSIPAEYRVPAPTYAQPETVPDETVAVVAVDSKQALPDAITPPVAAPAPQPYSTPKPAVNRPASDEKPPLDNNSLFLLLTVALVAGILTMGGLYAYKRWQVPGQETMKPDSVRKPPAHKDSQTPANPDPIIQGSDEAAIQGVASAIGGKESTIVITPALSKKKTKQGWQLIDSKGRSKGVYDEIREPSDDFIAVRQKDKWGYINDKGQIKITCQFDKAGDFEGGRALVTQKGTEYEIDKKGNPVDNQAVQPEAVQPETVVQRHSPIG